MAEPAVLAAAHHGYGGISVQGWLLLAWVVPELGLAWFKRSRTGAVSHDRRSLGLIWGVVTLAVWLGILAAHRLRTCGLPEWTLAVGVGLVVTGLGLRWYAILVLGRFFTTNVALASDHRLVESGPYRFIRHPSYTGHLLAVLGIGLSLENWASLLILFLPTCAVMLWRIHIEEQTLAAGLGAVYREYMGRTKRLIPWVY